MEGEWIDDGPVVRPFALVRGRTPPPASSFELLTLIVATGADAPGAAELGPEHRRLLALVRRSRPVVEVASDVDLPLGVLRLLLADLLDQGLILTRSPTPAGPVPQAELLREVIEGLRAL
ncbi:DUF742 domain-containing protein [Sphaerisporangium aureirubrum]|uniref:DUF742 domain-containing protein n=1 Tax=Sphaerisporangium aureirubrum TaxID=1544736 RepID=A0ABW1NAD3_9ACTN